MQSLWMLAAGLSFAAMGVFVKLAAAQFSVAELVLYRMVVLGLAGLALLKLRGLSLRTPRLGTHAHRGVAGFVSMFMFFYALTTLPVTTAMTLNYSSPLFLAVLLAVVARERPGRGLATALVLGFAGVVVLLRPTLAPDQLWPAAVGLGSGAISAIAYWNVRALVQAGEPEARVVLYFALFGIAGSLVWMAPQPWHPITAGNAWQLAAIGVFGAAGQLSMTRAYGKGATLTTAALSYSGIVFSSLLAVLAFGEVLPAVAWLGVGLIVAAGIIAVRLRPGLPGGAAPPTLTND